MVGNVTKFEFGSFFEDFWVGFEGSKGPRFSIEKVMMVGGEDFFGFGFGDSFDGVFAGELLLALFYFL